MKIPIDRIQPNPAQPRREFDPIELASLADSICQHGLLNPIVTEDLGGGTYQLIDGERRWRACRIAWLDEIEAHVLKNVNGGGNRERLILAVTANVVRADLNPMEEAHAFYELRQAGMSVAEIADTVNVSQQTVHSRLSLLRFEPEIQDLFASKNLPSDPQTQAAIRSLPDETRVRYCQRFAANGMTVKRIAAICKAASTNAERRTRAVRTEPRRPENGWTAPTIAGREETASKIDMVAGEVCRRCDLNDMADLKVCSGCQLVEFIKAYFSEVKK
jgi:ParB family chromosome partitioning protein